MELINRPSTSITDEIKCEVTWVFCRKGSNSDDVTEKAMKQKAGTVGKIFD